MLSISPRKLVFHTFSSAAHSCIKKTSKLAVTLVPQKLCVCQDHPQPTWNYQAMLPDLAFRLDDTDWLFIQLTLRYYSSFLA